MLVSSFIGLAYEGISNFLYHKHNKALHKAVKAMDNKATIQCNKLMQMENNADVWCLQCGNLRKMNHYCTQHTQHNFLT